MSSLACCEIENGILEKENIFVRAKNKVKRFIENVKTVVRFIKILQASQNNNKW